MNLPKLPLVLLIGLTGGSLAADWPWWRGPSGNGVADPDQAPPLTFSTTDKVRWAVPIPGRGHGSPIIVGERVFLAVADVAGETQSVLCLDRATGEKRWSTLIHEGGLQQKLNKKATHASSTPACDGERVFVNFLSGDSVYTTALSLEGEKLWQRKVTKYKVHQGFGSSPAIYKDLVIVSADNKAGGALCAFKRVEGTEVWRVERPKQPNYPSPVIHEIGGRDQLLMQGCGLVSSYDPASGKKLWEIEGATTECVTSTVTDGTHIYSSGGYPRNHVAAIKADGSGEIVWQNTSRVYVPSMLIKDGYLYAVMDSGVAACWKSDTGKLMWKERLGRTTSASPVLVGNRIYSIDETGQFFVHAADPAGFEILAKNKLGDEALSTPTIVGGQIFARVAHNKGGKRQEMLYRIGDGDR